VALSLLVSLASDPAAIAAWLSWLATYFVHALVWAAAAALLGRSVSSAAKHFLWKVALFGPLLTAAMVAMAPVGFERAVGPRWAPHELVVSSIGTEPSVDVDGRRDERRSAYRGAGVCLVAISLLGVIRLAGSAFQVARMLRGRRRVREARSLARLSRLQKRMGLGPIELTESPHIASPMVVGRGEICLPSGILDELSETELDAVLAHELAHVERRDGLWFPLASLVNAVLWMQPINHWVAERLRHTAELACDDRAVELTGEPLALSHALVRVATANALRPHPSRWPLPGMANSARALRVRVQRLADGSFVAPQSWHRARAVAVVSVVATVTTCIGVQFAGAQELGIASAPSHVSDGPPDAAAASIRMAELIRRERDIEAQIAIARHAPSVEREGSEAAVHLLELEQDLSHVRATEVWIETRFTDAWATWGDRPRAYAESPR